MPKSLTQDEAYNICISEGKLLPIAEVDRGIVESMIAIAEEDLLSIADLKKKSDRWNTVYKLSYDVLHTLTEAFLMFDSIKSVNHQCLFAYLCVKHPELDLQWDFFEKVRTKRNGIHYYGASIHKEDWKAIEVQMSLYVNLLKTEIKKKMV